MESKFGLGIYTVSDASGILGIDNSRIRYWFNRYVSGEFKKIHDGYFYESGEVITVNFHTLIETYVFYHLKKKGVPTKKIIEAHNILSKHHNTAYPFALEEFLCSGSDLLHQVGEDIISLDKRRQFAIQKIILQFSENMDFYKKFASQYYPRGRSSSIVVNPNNQYGAPIIGGTNIKVSTILSLHRGGEDSQFIADLYDLNQEYVHDAIKFAA